MKLHAVGTDSSFPDFCLSSLAILTRMQIIFEFFLKNYSSMGISVVRQYICQSVIHIYVYINILWMALFSWVPIFLD